MEEKYSSNVLSGGKLGMVEVPNSRYVSFYVNIMQIVLLVFFLIFFNSLLIQAHTTNKNLIRASSIA